MFLVLARERCEPEEWRGRCADVGLELGVDIVLLPITSCRDEVNSTIKSKPKPRRKKEGRDVTKNVGSEGGLRMGGGYFSRPLWMQ